MKLSVLKGIFAAMVQGVVFIDEQNKIFYCNPAAEKIRNIQLDKVVGQSILECHPSESHPKVLQIIEDLRSGRVKGHHRMNIQMVEGKFYDNTYSAVWGPENEYLGVVVVSQEVTERKKTEDELKDALEKLRLANEELKHLDELKDVFLSNVSHELKTPICAMRGEAEVLLTKERKTEEYQEGLAHFIEQFDHLNQMINDLILLSKFDAAQVELKMVSLRLDLLVKDLCNLFQVLAEQKKITLEIDAAQEVTVSGDKIRLQQLFTNLIDNAIKYTPEGTIRIILERNREAVLVKVSDTGIGISQAEQKNIFKRFYRVDKSRSRETGGVGLGLSIVEWIAHAHHGKIEVASELNQGSTFTVYLPLPKILNI